ncbi:MAG: ADOP family duplicated permease [Candidatus Acidiferrales bacterium]
MPEWNPEIVRRLAPLKLSPTREAEIADELAQHLEDRYQELLASGRTDDEACRTAIKELEGEDFLVRSLRRIETEFHREPIAPGKDSKTLLSGILQDIRYALRMLRKSPGFTAIAVLTLALGIGANTAIFSMADAFLVHPISLPHVNRVVMLSWYQKAPAYPADYLYWKGQSGSFEKMAAYRQDDMNLTGGSAPERVYGSRVTPDFFATLGVEPAMGRTFTSSEGEPAHSQVAILSYGLWHERFAGDPQILGKRIEIDGQHHTVIGVMPKDLDFPVPTDLWTPLALTPAERADRAHANLHVIARLKDGIPLERAQSGMSILAQRLAQAYPATDKNLTIRVMPVSQFVEGSITRSYTFMFLMAVGIVLLIACANIANLQLARSSTRQKEIAVRTALGARRWRIVRLLLVENILLGVLGGAASVALAAWALNAMDSNMPAEIARLVPGWYEIRMDSRALVFTLGIAILSGVIAGLMPALGASRVALNESLKEAGTAVAGGSRSRQRLRGAFVVAQIVVALMVVISAMLMVKGFRKLVRTQESYAGGRVLIAAVNLPASRYPTDATRAAFYRNALEKLQTIPGVSQAETFYTIPISNNGTDWRDFQIEGQTAFPLRRGRGPAAVLQPISAGYFSMLRIPLVQGRAFTNADNADSQPVAIVSENLAHSYWPGKSAIGRHVKLGSADSKQPWLTVVGVASNVLYDWTDQLPEPAIYVPFAQSPLSETLLAIRTNADAGGFAPAARAAIASVDPQLPAFSVMPLSSAIHGSIVGLAYTADMMAALGSIALLIALVGVYGVMAYAVAERTHEFGVRMALGARPSDVLWLVSRRGAWLGGAGVVLGVPLAVATARVLAGLIYGTAAMDWSVFAGIAALIAVVIAAACYIPARRAMRVDPMVALRYE